MTTGLAGGWARAFRGVAVAAMAMAAGCIQPATTQPSFVADAAAPTSTPPTTAATQPGPSLAHAEPLTTQPAAATRPYRVDPRIKELASLCRSRYATVRDYQALFIKDEITPSKVRKSSEIRIRFRETPWSVHMNWIAGSDRYKQAIFVQGRYDNKIQIKAGHILFAPRLALPLNDPMVRQASRRSIREAGVGNLVKKLVMLSETTDPGLYGPVSYVGVETVGQRGKLERIDQQAKDIPGGKRVWYISRELGLPLLVETFDRKGKRLGHYEYRDFEFNIGLGGDDFDPNKVYK